MIGTSLKPAFSRKARSRRSRPGGSACSNADAESREPSVSEGMTVVPGTGVVSAEGETSDVPGSAAAVGVAVIIRVTTMIGPLTVGSASEDVDLNMRK